MIGLMLACAAKLAKAALVKALVAPALPPTKLTSPRWQDPGHRHRHQRRQLIEVSQAWLLAERSNLAPELTRWNLHADAAGRFEGRVHGAGEAGQGQGFGAAALVELLLPDDVVGLFGALVEDAGFDALQNDSGGSTGFFSDTGADLRALQLLVIPRV